MPNPWFNFKQFKVWQKDSAFKVGTDSVLLGAWCNLAEDRKVLDIGTGTGLLALMSAQRSNADILAIEPDKLSAAEASINIAKSPWNRRISVLVISIQDFVDSTEMVFDHIITNPPYFKDSLQNPDRRLSKARHNYDLSTEEMLNSVSKLLSGSGKLSLVLPYTEANLFIAEAANFGLYCSRMLKIKPLPDRPVKRILMEFVRERVQSTTAFLVIEKGMRHDYSHEYRSLTKDFYLEF